VPEEVKCVTTQSNPTFLEGEINAGSNRVRPLKESKARFHIIPQPPTLSSSDNEAVTLPSFWSPGTWSRFYLDRLTPCYLRDKKLPFSPLILHPFKEKIKEENR